MAQPVHDHLVRFRASRELVATATKVARERDMTLSEYLRAAVRRELARAA
jgi:hypothetical protein